MPLAIIAMWYNINDIYVNIVYLQISFFYSDIDKVQTCSTREITRITILHFRYWFTKKIMI